MTYESYSVEWFLVEFKLKKSWSQNLQVMIKKYYFKINGLIKVEQCLESQERRNI